MHWNRYGDAGDTCFTINELPTRAIQIENSFNLERSVVGDDGGKGGDCALAAAKFLQDELGVAPHVIHSINLPDASIGGSHPEELVAARAAIAERAEAWFGKRIAGVFPEGVQHRVELGQPATALLRAARSLPAELVVVGPHEDRGLFDFGGTQRKVFSSDATHVWSQPTPNVNIERILVPLDFHEGAEDTVKIGLDLARKLSLPLVVMHCSDSVDFVDPSPIYGGGATMPMYVVEAVHEAARNRFETWFKEFDWSGCNATHRFVTGSAAAGILEEQGVQDLVVMGTKGHTGIAAAFLGGVTYAVLKAHRGPVLAVKR